MAMHEPLKDFVIYDLADFLLKLLDSASPEMYEPCGMLTAKYVIAEWAGRGTVVGLAQHALETRAIESWRTLADAILGVAEPDLLDETFLLASDFFKDTPERPEIPAPIVTNPSEPLPFHRLGNFRLFEHLCYDWIVGLSNAPVYLYGKPPQDQHGVDIVAFASQASPALSRNAYFQCKLYNEFTKTHLRAAIKKFERDILIHKARSFVVVVGCDVSDTNVLEEFERQKHRLKACYRVNLVLLDAQLLTTFLGQSRRDLIHKYFGPSYDRPYLSIQRKANDLGEQQYTVGGDELFPADLDVVVMSGLLIAKNQDVNMQITLPDSYSHAPLCGAISLRMLEHMQIGLGQEEVNDLFSDVRVPLEDRPFIRGVINEGQATTTMMISGCRVYPSVRVAASFSSAVDACHDALIQKLREYDRTYETEGFQVVRSPYGFLNQSVLYRVAAIDSLVWQCVKDAVNDPEFTLGLEEAVAVLGEERLHVITGPDSYGISPRADFYVYDDGKWPSSHSVFWEPPTLGYMAAPPHWGALTAVRWFVDRLIPVAIRHREQRAAKAWQKRPRWYAPFRELEMVVVPHFDPYVDRAVYIQRLLDRADDIDSLLRAVNALQSYLGGEKRTWDIEHRRRMITVLLVALRKAKLQEHSLRYVTTEIYDAMTKCSQREIIRMLEASLATPRVLEGAEGDHFLRAVGEMLQKTDCPLSEVELQEIAELLAPFARVHDDKLRLKLHTPQSWRAG